MSEAMEVLDTGVDSAQEIQARPGRGTGMRQAREAAGLHIAALAAALKVPVKKLEALEAGRYEELPDLTFARALASSACRHLKIDPALILEAIPQAHAPVLGVPSDSLNEPFKADLGTFSFASFHVLKTPSMLTALALLLAACGVAFLPNWSQWPVRDWFSTGSTWIQDFSRSEPSLTNVQGSPVSSGVVPELVPAQPVVALSAEPGAMVSDTDTVSQDKTLGMTEVSELQEATTGVVLRLEAMNDSWIEVIDALGKVQGQRVLKKGDVMDFSNAPPYAVVLGRADAVAVQVRGQAFDVLPFSRNSVARFEVK